MLACVLMALLISYIYMDLYKSRFMSREKGCDVKDGPPETP